jgi:perosamine synthetase
MMARLVTERTRPSSWWTGAGQPADWTGSARSRDRGAPIEDAAYALGAEYHGWRVGAIADLTTFSFHPVKRVPRRRRPSPRTMAYGRPLRRFGTTGSRRSSASGTSGLVHRAYVDLGYNY